MRHIGHLISRKAKKKKVFAKSFSKLPYDTQQKFRRKEIKTIDGHVNLKINITGHANTVSLLDENTKKVAGVSDWNENHLPARKNLLVEKIKGGYATHGTSTDPIRLYTGLHDNVPVALLNANLQIDQEGETLVDLPISYLFAEAKSDKNNSDSENCYNLENPVFLREGIPVDMKIVYPNGASVPVSGTIQHFLSLTLMGDMTRI